ncbi:MAG: ribokinase [Sphingomonas sp.]|nr:ribokinase [Sphingomonas sp.]
MRVTVLGSINVDTILSVVELPRPGETVMASASVRAPGGKGANQAVAAARMGASTSMIGAVGDDPDGAWMRSLLEKDGIAVASVLALPGVATGAAAIAVDARAENLIIVSPGANSALTPSALPTPTDDVLLAQFEVPVATIAAAFADARGPRLLNAAPAMAEGAFLFAQSDVVIVNEHELAFYAGCDAIETREAAETAARPLLSRDDQAIVVTLGADGALAIWRDRAVHVPGLPVTPVDTVGAGDCFCGSLAALIAEGRSLEAALPLANAAAALCTQARGAAPAMPRRSAVEAFCDAPKDRASPVKTPPDAGID